MIERYLQIKARNLNTGQTVKMQDLTGERFTVRQRHMAEDRAKQYAQALTQRGPDVWVPVVEEYTPSSRR